MVAYTYDFRICNLCHFEPINQVALNNVKEHKTIAAHKNNFNQRLKNIYTYSSQLGSEIQRIVEIHNNFCKAEISTAQLRMVPK